MLCKVNVSSLAVRKDVKTKSKVFITRDTIVKTLGEGKTYRGNRWEVVRTLQEPVVEGYVLKKYLIEI